jgi:RNA polymerase sigma factor (TIGR02999 family)
VIKSFVGHRNAVKSRSRCGASAGDVSWADVSDVTRILSAIERGDPSAADELLPLVYDELRRLAARKLAKEQPGQTLEATALVHEAYVRLVDADHARQWNSRGHFFAAAAEGMRRILIENARRKKSQKHGGDRRRIELGDVALSSHSGPEGLLLLDEALTLLAEEDRRAAEIAKLRLFAGLSVEDIARVLDVSRATAFRNWTYARAWLQARLGDEDKPHSE